MKGRHINYSMAQYFAAASLLLAAVAAQPLTGTWSMFQGDCAHTGRAPASQGGKKPNGTVTWTMATSVDSMLEASPVIARDGTIIFGSLDYKLYAATPTGSLSWTFTTGGQIYSTPAIASDGTVYFGSQDGNVYALAPNGTLKWSYRGGGG
jgi:outer membrane protein assembly factor BamB